MIINFPTSLLSSSWFIMKDKSNLLHIYYCFHNQLNDSNGFWEKISTDKSSNAVSVPTEIWFAADVVSNGNTVLFTELEVVAKLTVFLILLVDVSLMKVGGTVLQNVYDVTDHNLLKFKFCEMYRNIFMCYWKLIQWIWMRKVCGCNCIGAWFFLEGLSPCNGNA